MNKKLGYLLVLAVLFGSAVFVRMGHELKSQILGIAYGFFLGWLTAAIAIELKKMTGNAKE